MATYVVNCFDVKRLVLRSQYVWIPLLSSII